jgi:hypothetical protein
MVCIRSSSGRSAYDIQPATPGRTSRPPFVRCSPRTRRHCSRRSRTSKRWEIDRYFITHLPRRHGAPVPYFHVVYTLPAQLRDLASRTGGWSAGSPAPPTDTAACRQAANGRRQERRCRDLPGSDLRRRGTTRVELDGGIGCAPRCLRSHTLKRATNCGSAGCVAARRPCSVIPRRSWQIMVAEVPGEIGEPAAKQSSTPCPCLHGIVTVLHNSDLETGYGPD